MEVNGIKVPKAQYDFYLYLLPYFSDSELIMEQWVNVKGTKLDTKYGKKLIRLDIIHEPTKLVIEVDGSTHIGCEECDKDRDDVLEELGYFTYRIKNEEVYNAETRKATIHLYLESVISREYQLLPA